MATKHKVIPLASCNAYIRREWREQTNGGAAIDETLVSYCTPVCKLHYVTDSDGNVDLSRFRSVRFSPHAKCSATTTRQVNRYLATLPDTLDLKYLRWRELWGDDQNATIAIVGHDLKQVWALCGYDRLFGWINDRYPARRTFVNGCYEIAGGAWNVW